MVGQFMHRRKVAGALLTAGAMACLVIGAEQAVAFRGGFGGFHGGFGGFRGFGGGAFHGSSSFGGFHSQSFGGARFGDGGDFDRTTDAGFGRSG